MSEVPKPASPLPWADSHHNATGMTGTVFEKSVLDATGRGPVVSQSHMADWDHADQNRAYLVWAANNAPALYEALEKLVALCKHANKDAFSNGVTDGSGAIDEGDVRAGEWIHQADEALRAAKETK